MAHHNFYDSLGLDRSNDADTLGREIDQRLQSQSLNDATRDELQVARRILGDSGRRKVYDTRLDDPSAPVLDVRALRQIAAAEPATATQTEQKPELRTEKIERKPEQKPETAKPKQYFPDTDPNAEAVGAAPGSTSVYAPAQGQGQGYYPATGAHQGTSYSGYQGQNPGQPQYSYPAQQAPAEAKPAPKKKGAAPWLVGLLTLALLAALGAGGWWWWTNRGEDWAAPEQQMADTFPQIISEKDGQRGWPGMTCTSLPANNGEEARIRCADSELGVSIMDYGNEADRDAQLPAGDAEVIGNNVCSARSYKMEGVTPPAFMIAPEGADAQYLFLVNGGDAESKRMYLNLCEKSRD